MIAPGQRWRDDTGTAVVLVVVRAPGKGEFAVMQRLTPKRSNPFVVPVRSLLREFDGWTRGGTAP